MAGEKNLKVALLIMDINIVVLLLSIIAGAITILSPCILPLLPLIIISSDGSKNKNSRLSGLARASLIIVSLSVSIFVFTLLFKVSTAFIGTGENFLRVFAGLILFGFGLLTIYPEVWDKINQKLGFRRQSNRLLAKGLNRSGIFGGVLVGLSLGPIFSSCSPTYFLIIAIITESSLAIGIVYLLGYIFGLGLVLVLISLFGQLITARLAGLSNPKGWFKRLIGVSFIIVGFLVIFGLNRPIETWLVEQNLFFNPSPGAEIIEEVAP